MSNYQCMKTEVITNKSSKKTPNLAYIVFAGQTCPKSSFEIIHFKYESACISEIMMM